MHVKSAAHLEHMLSLNLLGKPEGKADHCPFHWTQIQDVDLDDIGRKMQLIRLRASCGPDENQWPTPD